jgi:hypothetical protein
MGNKIELLGGVLRLTPFWMGVNLLFMAHFLCAWIFSYRKSGWKIDLWYFTLFYHFFVQVMVMYPFNASAFNALAVGNQLLKLDDQIDHAFFITMLGYLFLWVGRALYNLMKKDFPLFSLFRLLAPFSRLVERNIKNPQSLLPLLFFPLLFLIAILFLAGQEGLLWNPRALYLREDALRPLYNLTHALFSIALTFLALRAIYYRKRSAFLLFTLFFLLSLLLGVRAVAIWGALTLILFAIFSKEGRFSFFKVGSASILLALLALYMDSVRTGQYDFATSLSSSLLNLFYGNHFSHTRDFAWVLSSWDETLIWGKSYLAALLSFLPRILSPFRQDWSISVYANSIVGIDSSLHAGIGLGTFGEVFLNFSYAGVALLGLVVGYILRAADVALKEAVALKQDIIKGYASTLAYIFISSFLITAGFWTFYVFLLFNLCLALFNRLQLFPKLSLR